MLDILKEEEYVEPQRNEFLSQDKVDLLRRMFGAKRVFNDITNIVTFRYESYFRNPVIDWYEQLNGPADRIEWMKKNLDKRFSTQQSF